MPSLADVQAFLVAVFLPMSIMASGFLLGILILFGVVTAAYRAVRG